jgi:hypothetical protein
MSIDAGRPHHRDVTAPTRDVTTPPATEPEPEFVGLRRRLVELTDENQTLRRKLEIKGTERNEDSERWRAWLVEISLRTNGKACGLAQQALYSGEWPDRARLPSSTSRPSSEENDDE